MNFKKRIGGVLVSAGTTLAIVTALGGGIAHADPTGAPTARLISLVGSETTTPVMQAMSQDTAALAIGGVRQVGSFNATGSATIDTKGGTVPACTAIGRPNGSSAGRTALLTSLNAANGCIQGSRSSSDASATAADPNLVYIPFANEAISFAITNTSSFPKNIPFAELQTFWACTHANLVGGTVPYKVMLPQSGSGTRSYWIEQMYGGTAVPSPTPACLQNGSDENSVLIEEHNGTQVNNTEIVPFSVAQWSSQTSGVINDVRGNTRVGQVDLKNPFASDFGLVRPLFNVFAQSDVTAVSPPAGSVAHGIQTLFVGAGSQICSQANAVAITKRFGLTPHASCGSATLVTP